MMRMMMVMMATVENVFILQIYTIISTTLAR